MMRWLWFACWCVCESGCVWVSACDCVCAYPGSWLLLLLRFLCHQAHAATTTTTGQCACKQQAENLMCAFPVASTALLSLFFSLLVFCRFLSLFHLISNFYIYSSFCLCLSFSFSNALFNYNADLQFFRGAATICNKAIATTVFLLFPSVVVALEGFVYWK